MGLIQISFVSLRLTTETILMPLVCGEPWAF